MEERYISIESMELALKEHRKNAEIIEEQIRKCLISSLDMAEVLDLPLEDIPEICGEGTTNDYFGDIKLDPSIEMIDCTPEKIKELEPTSILYLHCVMKLRSIISFLRKKTHDLKTN